MTVASDGPLRRQARGRVHTRSKGRCRSAYCLSQTRAYSLGRGEQRRNENLGLKHF